MRRSGRAGARVLGVLLGVLLTACGSAGGDGESEAAPFPVRTTAGDAAGCTDGAPHRAVCWFIKSLRAGDLTGFTERERQAEESAGLLPDGDWFVASCERASDSFYTCRVPFDGEDVGVFEVVAADGSTGTPADRYEVVQYRGSVPAG